MSRRFLARTMMCITFGLVVLAMAAPGWGQETRGRINVTVLDPQKNVVPDAGLELVDLATNETRKAATQTAGNYSFINLPPGRYKLTVTKSGFRAAVYDQVTVSATKGTDVETILQVGAPTDTITVEAVAPIVETTQVTIGQVIDMKHIDGLPLQGRDISGLARIVPGYTGTWNGLPQMAQGNNVDGVIGSSSRMKFNGNSAPSVQVRLENIEEMTVQTDQLDMNQGFGQAIMQSNFITRRGTNAFHGNVFWDLRNDNLNANSWSNNARGVKRAESKLNEFGGNIGGPILKDKLFFFFSLSTARQPGASTRSSTYLTASAQQGNFTYVGTDGQTRTVNIFNAAKAYDPKLQTTLNSVIAAQMTRINSAVQNGITSTTTDPIINSVNWSSINPTTRWFPTFRVDYTPGTKWRVNLAVNQTKSQSPHSGAPYFPGDEFVNIVGGNKSNNITSSLGIDWTATNTLLNSFRFGYLYTAGWNPWGSGPEFEGYTKNPERVGWPLVTSPMQWNVPISTFYPVFNLSDTVSWQKGAHTLNIGFSAYREQDHYWNPPELTNTTLALVAGDPAMDALTNTGSYQPLPFANTTQQANARGLYALLAGRISNIQGSYPYDTKTSNYIQERARYFTLNEVSKAYGLFIQDSWRFRPNLTVNAGLRWDFTVASKDKNAAYHNVELSSIWGPSGVGNLFKPGTLNGNLNPTVEERPQPYNSWYKTPQPSLGFAWSPKFSDGFMKRLLGEGNTVIRASFSLRNFSVPYQYFWNNASNYGSFFYQSYQTTARNVSGVGSFTPGSLSLGQTYPQYLLAPASYSKSAPLGNFTFNMGSYGCCNGSNGIKYDISQPYTMSWTFGIQQKLGQSRALEIRYNGNRTVKQWISQDVNEVNVFENGFLQEFKNAQKNLAVNGGSSFGNLNPAGGTVALPIMTAAFTGDRNGAQTNAQFRSSSFITNMNTGAVGSMANSLTRLGAAPFFCNLVGASFGPCAKYITTAGGGYPINFFQANPYASGNPSTVMSDAGYANYHSLQVDFRQRFWHGLQFDANYTWSHTLGVGGTSDWTGANYTNYTMRNLRENYGPTNFDIRHIANISGTVDLPFGSGRKFLNQKGPIDKIIGGWTIGTITTFRTGDASRLTGGYSTYNNIADGGINLTGVTREELQKSVGVYKTGANFVTMIDPKYRTTGVGANTTYITANTTPGIYATPLWIYGPFSWQADISISKDTVMTEQTRINFQAQLLNAFNHPVFRSTPGGGVRSSGWATATGASNSARVIEFRLRISY